MQLTYIETADNGVRNVKSFTFVMMQLINWLGKYVVEIN